MPKLSREAIFENYLMNFSLFNNIGNVRLLVNLILCISLLKIIFTFVFCYLSCEVKVAQSCPTLCDPMDYIFHGILQARILEWITFPFSRDLSNPAIKPRSPTLQADSLLESHKGSPGILEWIAYPFYRGSSQPRNWTRVSCVAGAFFTNWAIREALLTYKQKTMQYSKLKNM